MTTDAQGPRPWLRRLCLVGCAALGLLLIVPNIWVEREDVEALLAEAEPQESFRLKVPPADFCRDWFGRLERDLGMRPLEEALNMTLPPRMDRAQDMPIGMCELVLRVSGDTVWMHRKSRAAGSFRRRKGWFYCPPSLQVGRFRRLDQVVGPKWHINQTGPRCRSPLRGSHSINACCMKVIFPDVVLNFLDILALLRSNLGVKLPPFSIPVESADVPWCTRWTSQHTNSSEPSLQIPGGVPTRPRSSLVLSHSRPHPAFVPHSLLMPLSSNQAFARLERHQQIQGGEWGRLSHQTKWGDPQAANKGVHHNPPPNLGEYRRIRAAVPWASRRAKAVWRGAPTGAPRLHYLWGIPGNRTARRNVFMLAQSDPTLDVAFGKMPLEELMRHKLVLAVDGHSYASVLKHVLLGGSLAVRVGGLPSDSNPGDKGSSFEWFEPLLRDRVHYLRVSPAATDLAETVRWALANDGEAHRIARRGTALMRELQSPVSALCYAYSSLTALSKRQAPLRRRDPDFGGGPPNFSEWVHVADIPGT
eukprot:Hpha_TRINITY_DN24057_c0_g1::TRINITY_DN24057_c0_g1_i1::g.130345::m.130345